MKAVFLLVLMGICGPVIAQEYFQTALQQGSYTVGFKSATYYDLGRPAIAEQSINKNGRAVSLDIWYPATIKNGARPMTFSEYINPFSVMINPAPVTEKTKKESLRLANFFLSQIGGDSVLFKQHLPDLLRTPVHAYLNAPFKPGAYPVLIYPESAYLSNILCEYLASHGYIVICVSRYGTLSAEFEWQNVRGIEGLVLDCQFTLAEVKKEFRLNDPPIALMGVGMNASAGLAWMMRNPTIDALVSLEGGILTGYEYMLIQKSPFFDVTRASKPMLVFYSPHEAVNPLLIDNYKYADRHMMFMPAMKEFYYLNYGVWESTIKNILGPAPGDTRKGFETVAQYTLQFLNWQLKGSEDGKAYLAKTPQQHNVPASMAEYSLKHAALIPPSQIELEQILSKDGFSALKEEVKKYLQNDKQAFTYEVFFSLGQQLLTSKKYEHGVQWASLFQESYPAATAAYTIAGRCNLELGNKEAALKMYTQALQLLEGDVFLDQAGKNQLKPAIEARVEQLIVKR